MDRYLGRFAPQVYAIMRIVAGFVFLTYGTQKVLGWPATRLSQLVTCG